MNTNTDPKEIVIVHISTKLLEQRENRPKKKSPNIYHKDDGGRRGAENIEHNLKKYIMYYNNVWYVNI